jgi:hypothetical protein
MKFIILSCLVVSLLCILPFSYFMAFPATDETSRQATQLPKGIAVEFCFNFHAFERDGKHDFETEIRWAAPGSFAVNLRSPYFTRCGYLPWLPFVEYPEKPGIIRVPRFKFSWGTSCWGNCP